MMITARNDDVGFLAPDDVHPNFWLIREQPVPWAEIALLMAAPFVTVFPVHEHDVMELTVKRHFVSATTTGATTTADPPHHPTGTTPEAVRLWGSDDLREAFTTDKRVVPWRSAPRRKGEPLAPPAEVARLLEGGPALADVDPRALFATQTWVVASHVAYYRTDRWETTGTTSADQHQVRRRCPRSRRHTRLRPPYRSAAEPQCWCPR